MLFAGKVFTSYQQAPKNLFNLAGHVIFLGPQNTGLIISEKKNFSRGFLYFPNFVFIK